MKRRSGGRNFPPVLGLTVRWRERLGLPECPYVHRWRVEIERLGSLRVHRWFASDDPRARHDHPWWFVTLVIKGGYLDVGTHRSEHLRAPAVRFRPALHRHTVIPDSDGCWTVVVTGPKRRAWGFWVGNRFYKANKWFGKFGHHPCD